MIKGARVVCAFHERERLAIRGLVSRLCFGAVCRVSHRAASDHLQPQPTRINGKPVQLFDDVRSAYMLEGDERDDGFGLLKRRSLAALSDIPNGVDHRAFGLQPLALLPASGP